MHKNYLAPYLSIAAPAIGIPVALISRAVTHTKLIAVLVNDNSSTSESMIMFTPHENDAIAQITIIPEMNTMSHP